MKITTQIILKQASLIMLFAISFLLCQQNLFAQAPETLWMRTYDNTRFSAVLETDAADIFTAGRVRGEMGLVKFNASGDTLWTKSYPASSFSGEGWANSFQQTTDGGFILGGLMTTWFSPNDNAWLKTDATGTLIWQKTLDLTYYDGLYAIQVTSDGGYMLAGATSALVKTFEIVNYPIGAWLIKTDALGDTLWLKFFSTNDTAFTQSGANALQPTADGGYILAGYTDIFGDYDFDFLLIKTDTEGNTMWSQVFGYSQGSNDIANAVVESSDGGYILAGQTDHKAWVVKTDQMGNKLWSITYDYPVANSILGTTDGGYITAGGSMIVRADSTGNLLWSKTFSGSSANNIHSVQATLDGGYILAGNTANKGWLIRLKRDPVGIELDTSGLMEGYQLFQNYPNPFNPVTIIRYDLPKASKVILNIYNILGQEVRTLVKETQPAGQWSIVWDGSYDDGKPVSSGVYIYRLTAGNFVQSHKMLLLR